LWDANGGIFRRWGSGATAWLGNILLCDDDDLDYQANRTRFAPGTGFALDEAYRLAHLPLVAPLHPKVIVAKSGTGYEKGRHGKALSLVLPVPDVDHLLESELKAAPFATKIAWDVAERRRGRLHATLCGSPPAIDRAALATIGPITVEVRGLFSGNVNHGRLYLRVYPEKRSGENQLKRVQRLVGGRETGLYLVGLHNFTDDLDALEAAALAALIERWWDRPILRWQVDALWLLAAWDDLVLDGNVEETIPLCAAR
jgi:hypothetical protein